MWHFHAYGECRYAKHEKQAGAGQARLWYASVHYHVSPYLEITSSRSGQGLERNDRISGRPRASAQEYIALQEMCVN